MRRATSSVTITRNGIQKRCATAPVTRPVVELLTAVVVILAPLLGVGVTAWAESIKQRRDERTEDEVDRYIQDHLDGDPDGLRNLAARLDELHRKAQRKAARRG